MKRIIALLIILIILMSSCISLELSNTIYVSTAGNDSSTGSFGSPFKTIQKAVSVSSPGTKISILPGTYNENIVISNSGTVTDPITMMADSGIVVINGGSTIALRNNGAIAYWIIDNLSFKSTDRYTLRLGWWGEPVVDHLIIKNSNIQGANYSIGSYITWENNNVDGTGYSGTFGDAGLADGGNSHHNIYRGNIIHDFTMYDSRGIWTQGLTHDSLIENNTVYNIGGNMGQCIDLDGYAQVEWRHIVRDNDIYNCGYVGIQLENVFDGIIENNIIKNTGPAGIIAISYDQNGCKVGGENNQYGDRNGDGNCQGDQTNTIIRQNLITATNWGWGYGGIINWYAGGLNILGNTIISQGESGNGGINFQGNYDTTKGAIIKSNIISQGNGTAICALDFASFSEDYSNIVYQKSGSMVYSSGASCDTRYSLLDYQTRTGKGQGNINSDPLLTSDYHLNINSPAIGQGLNIGTTMDLGGTARPYGGSYDIGAYEFVGNIPVQTMTTIAFPTLTVTKVPATITATAMIPTITRTISKTPTRTFTTIPTVTLTLLPTKTPTAFTFTCTFVCVPECTFTCKTGK
jgi:hypothetical protein